MRSLKDIYNKEYFRNSKHEALINIIFTGSYIVDFLKNILAAKDITYQQYNFLLILQRAEKPLSSWHIKEQMLDRSSDTSRICERMISKGWISKTTSSEDKRLVCITLTNEGKKLIEELSELNVDIDNIAGNLNEDELSVLSNLLDKLRKKTEQ